MANCDSGLCGVCKRCRETAKQRVKWIGSEPKCDFCGNADMAEFVDGKTKLGPWGLMCLRHYFQFGVGLGMGRGQRYRRSGGSYFKVEG